MTESDQNIFGGDGSSWDSSQMIPDRPINSATAELQGNTNEKSPLLSKFELDPEKDQKYKAIITNPKASEGILPKHLVHRDETVVKFTGTPQELALLIGQLQGAPLIEDLSPTESTITDQGESIKIKRTGLQVVVGLSLEVSGRKLIQPQSPDNHGRIPFRYEVVGCRIDTSGACELVLLPPSVEDAAVIGEGEYIRTQIDDGAVTYETHNGTPRTDRISKMKNTTIMHRTPHPKSNYDPDSIYNRKMLIGTTSHLIAVVPSATLQG